MYSNKDPDPTTPIILGKGSCAILYSETLEEVPWESTLASVL